MACTLAAVLACAPVTSESFKASLTEARFCAVTPLTPKASYCAKLGVVAVAVLLCAAPSMAAKALMASVTTVCTPAWVLNSVASAAAAKAACTLLRLAGVTPLMPSASS